MKKIIALIVCLLITVSVIACTKDNPPEESSKLTNDSEITSVQADSNNETKATDTLPDQDSEADTSPEQDSEADTPPEQDSEVDTSSEQNSNNDWTNFY